MQEPDLFFVIPTYRLREVGETVEQYDEHFWRNGHAVRMIVFDDSSPANQEKYYPPGRSLPRATSQGGRKWLQPQVVRHPRVLPRRVGQARRPGAGQLRTRPRFRASMN